MHSGLAFSRWQGLHTEDRTLVTSFKECSSLGPGNRIADRINMPYVGVNVEKIVLVVLIYKSLAMSLLLNIYPCNFS